MVNLRKLYERWDRQDERRELWWENLTEAQRIEHEKQQDAKVKAKMKAEDDAARNLGNPYIGMTSLQCAQYDKEHSDSGSLAWHLAEAELQGDTWCSLDEDVFAEQDRQNRMREKYGPAWSGAVKIRRFEQLNKNYKKPHAWKIVRWLEKRGFVEVGNGYVKWVGALE